MKTKSVLALFLTFAFVLPIVRCEQRILGERDKEVEKLQQLIRNEVLTLFSDEDDIELETFPNREYGAVGELGSRELNRYYVTSQGEGKPRGKLEIPRESNSKYSYGDNARNAREIDTSLNKPKSNSYLQTNYQYELPSNTVSFNDNPKITRINELKPASSVNTREPASSEIYTTYPSTYGTNLRLPLVSGNQVYSGRNGGSGSVNGQTSGGRGCLVARGLRRLGRLGGSFRSGNNGGSSYGLGSSLGLGNNGGSSYGLGSSLGLGNGLSLGDLGGRLGLGGGQGLSLGDLGGRLGLGGGQGLSLGDLGGRLGLGGGQGLSLADLGGRLGLGGGQGLGNRFSLGGSQGLLSSLGLTGGQGSTNSLGLGASGSGPGRYNLGINGEPINYYTYTSGTPTTGGTPADEYYQRYGFGSPTVDGRYNTVTDTPIGQGGSLNIKPGGRPSTGSGQYGLQTTYTPSNQDNRISYSTGTDGNSITSPGTSMLSIPADADSDEVQYELMFLRDRNRRRPNQGGGGNVQIQTTDGPDNGGLRSQSSTINGTPGTGLRTQSTSSSNIPGNQNVQEYRLVVVNDNENPSNGQTVVSTSSANGPGSARVSASSSSSSPGSSGQASWGLSSIVPASGTASGSSRQGLQINTPITGTNLRVELPSTVANAVQGGASTTAGTTGQTRSMSTGGDSTNGKLIRVIPVKP